MAAEDMVKGTGGPARKDVAPGTAEASVGAAFAAPGAAEAPETPRAVEASAPASIPPTREDGSPWPEVNGKKPGDPYYGVMLEQMEWEQRRRRRYSLVLAVQLAFLVAVIATIIYFAVTA